MVQINNLMSDIWKVFGLLTAGVLAVNAVQAAMGLADLAYWHYPTLAICWIFSKCKDESSDDCEVYRGRM